LHDALPILGAFWRYAIRFIDSLGACPSYETDGYCLAVPEGPEEWDSVLGETPSVRLTPEAFAKPPGGVRRAALELLTALRQEGVDATASPMTRSVTPTSATPSARRRVTMQLSEAAFFVS